MPYVEQLWHGILSDDTYLTSAFEFYEPDRSQQVIKGPKIVAALIFSLQIYSGTAVHDPAYIAF